jgi:hypothetical protein
MYVSKSYLQILLTITFALISTACDDDDSSSGSNASGPITSIGSLIGKANNLMFSKATECCNPAPDKDLLAFSTLLAVGIFSEAEGNGWIRFNADRANQCFEAFKTKIENSSCEALNQPASDSYDIDVKACDIYERLQTENEPCGSPIKEDSLTFEISEVCAGDLYCSKIQLDDQKRPTCQSRQNGVYCGTVEEYENGGYSSDYSEDLCLDAETCGIQRENGKLVAKCMTKKGEGSVCGEIKKNEFGISIDLEYRNCADDLMCGIQEKDGTHQAICMQLPKIGDICQIDDTYTYEGEMINTSFTYVCPIQSVCIKTDEKYTCQAQKKINEVCGEIDTFGLQPFAYDICEAGLVCRSKYQDSKNLITCQPPAQIGESCKNTWKNNSNDMSEPESYDYSDQYCVDGAMCEDQGEGSFNCVDDPQTVLVGESCDSQISCAGDAYCENGTCRSFDDGNLNSGNDNQSFCEELQSF